ncbi:MAG: class I adenylate-forming enzyme family protein [Woeseiaceae bacterium]
MRIIDFFDQGVRYHSGNVAFIDGEERLTYAEADSASRKIAAALHGRAYGKGTHIGIYSPNANIAFLALLGLMRAEGIWLPINPRNSTDTNIDLSERFDMEVLFYHSSFAEKAQQMADAVPGIKETVCLDGAAGEGMALDTWLEGYEDDFEAGAEEPDDLLAIFPTGGTTGKSKGVLMNHAAIETWYANYYTHFSYYENSVHLVVAPMTHTAGILGGMHFARGGTNIMMAQASPEGIMQAIHEHGVTHLFLPPTVLYMMLAHENVANYDFSSLQHFIVGAAPTSLEKLKEAVKVFGPVMTEAYGQVEAPAAVAMKAPWDYLDADGNINDQRLKGIGRPGAFNQVAILDDDGKEVPRGEAGEICLRGRLVTLGYYKNSEATAEVREFGWHHTGDVGVMDDDGYITIVDRKKDMIITGGFNVYPNEVEQVLSEHPAVQEAAVIGIPDDKWGEAVKAIVQLKPGQEATDSELIAMVKEKLGGVKAPKTVDIMDDLPRSAVGKVLKTELRKPYWEGADRNVS